MTRFIDGPAEGVTLMLRRAPVLLRAVKGSDWDALDQLTDAPSDDEAVVVYELVGEPTWMHVRATGGRSGIYRGGSYRLVDPQPPDDVLRDNAKWREWAISRMTEHVGPK